MNLNALNRRKVFRSELDEARAYLRDGTLPLRLRSQRQRAEFARRWAGFSLEEGEGVHYKALRVVPFEEVGQVLAELSRDPRTGGSRDRLFERASERFVGVSRRACMAWLRDQEVWQLRQPSFAPAIRQPIVSTRPFQRTQADLVDMRSWNPGLNNDTHYLLTAIDTFTKQAWAVPLRNKEGASVARAFDESVLANADQAPSVVQTDRGSEFVSGEFEAVLRRHDVKHVFSRAFTPQSQGQIERWHGTLKGMLRTHMAHFKGSRRWVDVLPLVLEGYNTSRHTTTGFSPYQLLEAFRRKKSQADGGEDAAEAEETLEKAAQRIRQRAVKSMRPRRGRQPTRALEVGEDVRIKLRNTDSSRFGRHDPVWSERIFRITSVSKPEGGLSLPQYRLEGHEGRFCRNDLLEVTQARLVRRQTVLQRPVYNARLFDMEQHLARLHRPGDEEEKEPHSPHDAPPEQARPRRVVRGRRRLIEEMD